MLKTTLKIEGMACSMCEAHICAVIRQTVPEARKVSASHRKGEAEFQTEAAVDLEKLQAAITQTGYTMVSGDTEQCSKRSLFGWGR